MSSETSIATVSINGTVTALSEGECDITVYYRSNHDIYDVCHVTVASDYQCTTKTDIQQTYTNYSKHSAYGTNGQICPLTGTPKLLIIPVWFSDSSTYITDSTKKSNVKADIEKVYLGSNSDTGWRSVKTFYQQESNGALTLNGKVTDWLDLTDLYTNSTMRTSSYYAEDSDAEYLPRTTQLVTDAADWYFDNNPSDSRANYCHTEGSSYFQLDGVMLKTLAEVQAVCHEDEMELGSIIIDLGAGTTGSDPNILTI